MSGSTAAVVVWVVLLAALLATGGFATLFFALRDFSLTKLEDIASKNGGMAKLQAIVDDDAAHARALGVVMLLFQTVVVVCVAVLLPPRGVVLGDAGYAWLGTVVVVGVSAVLLFVSSMLLPIAVARYAGERVIHATPGFIRAVFVLTRPLTLLGFVDVAVKRLAGEASTTEREEIEDDIISAASEGERGGHLQAAEREMIRAVVGLGDTTVDEIMTPRTEIEGFQVTDDLGFIKGFVKEAGHSRIPVYREDLDHIAGMLYAKDLISYAGEGAEGFALEPLLRPVVLVPERKRVSELLPEMQRDKVHLAIVVDEYGGTSGLVTLEDIVEEIVGEIQDEYEPATEAEPEIRVDEPGRTADADARVNIDHANEALRALRLEIEESEDYDTLGGWVLARLGHIPVVGETFEADGCRVEVLEAEPTRVHRVRLSAVVEADAGAAVVEPSANGRARGEATADAPGGGASGAAEVGGDAERGVEGKADGDAEAMEGGRREAG